VISFSSELVAEMLESLMVEVLPEKLVLPEKMLVHEKMVQVEKMLGPEKMVQVELLVVEVVGMLTCCVQFACTYYT